MADEHELNQLLELIEARIDWERCLENDQRYLRSLAYETVDRPPLVVQPEFGHALNLPEPWCKFHRYSYREGFDDPAAMLQNMLLGRVVPTLVVDDDGPLAIRNDHGTIQVASAVGGNWKLHDDNFPWNEHFDTLEPIEAIANATGPVDLNAGVLPRSFATLRYYREKLAQFPLCAKAIQVSLPDLQGPFDNAEFLWGSSIYYAFGDCPELLCKLLSRLVDVTLQLHDAYKPFTYDRLDPTANTQHGYVMPGRLLLRDDSCLILSPRVYAEMVQPHDVRLLREVGLGGIHFCGNGQHMVETMSAPDVVKCLDFGQFYMMDGPLTYEVCRAHQTALLRVTPPREDLVSGKARRDYPTGVVMVYSTDNVDDARAVVQAYKSH
jgi:hypothetical protein